MPECTIGPVQAYGICDATPDIIKECDLTIKDDKVMSVWRHKKNKHTQTLRVNPGFGPPVAASKTTGLSETSPVQTFGPPFQLHLPQKFLLLLLKLSPQPLPILAAASLPPHDSSSCIVQSRSMQMLVALVEFARRNISFLRLRAGALGEELGDADLGFFGFERHTFLRRPRYDEVQAQESW